MASSSKPDSIEAIPPPVADYLALDLSPDGALGKQLLDGATAEAAQGEIALTNLVGYLPANFTPQMIEWYQIYVGQTRARALAAICGLFQERADSSKGGGFLLQTRLGTLTEENLRNKFAVYKNHNDNNLVDSKKLAELQAQIAEDTYRYNLKKAERNGNDAIVLNLPLYLGVLFFVVFGSETAINLDAFGMLPWATPFIAWGATILIGLAIGLAAHFHGTLFKQYGYWFGAAEDDTKRGPAWRMMIGGSLALSTSLAFVYYARSAYLISLVGSTVAFGQSDSGHSGFWVIGGSLLGNVIVYLIGVLWAYSLHDSDPDYAELKRSLDEKRMTADHLTRVLENGRRRDIEQLNAVFKRRSEEANRANAALITQPGLAWPLSLFREFQAKDGQVIGLLLAYRNRLMSALAAHAKDTRFILSCDDPHVPRRPIGPTEYVGAALSLKYLEEA